MWLDQVLVAAGGFSCSEAPGIVVLQLVIEPVSSASEGRFLTAGPPGMTSLSHDQVRDVAETPGHLRLCQLQKNTQPTNCKLCFIQGAH